MKAYNNGNWTDDWKKYEAGKKYNRKLKPPYYDNATINWDFYNSNQYPGLEDVDTPKPVFNIIKRLVSYFVSAITSTKISVTMEPMAYMDDDAQLNMEQNAATVVSAQVNNLFEQFRMPNKIKKAALDGAVQGDYCAHIMFNPNKKPYGGMFESKGIQGDIEFELIDGNNVYLGNPNNTIISKDVQPYVIIAGRDTVEKLKNEAESFKNDFEEIAWDSDTKEQVGQGGHIEIEADTDNTDKATYIILYKPNKSGTISVSKCVCTTYIYKDIDTGYTEYPVSWGVWEEQKNQYHGSALVTGIIPNQIFINRAFAIQMVYLLNNAFQKAVYNADRITSWTSDYGVAIPVSDLQPGESIKNVAGYLENGTVNGQVMQTIDSAIRYTMDLAGANENALGSVKPDNASAIIATQRQAAIPLENPRNNIKEWVYSIVMIMVDVMGTKYGTRPIVVEKDGQKQVVMFDFNTIKDINLNTKIQVGDGSYYSELAAIQTLDNYFANDKITSIEYFERIQKVNQDYIPDVQGLIDSLKAQQQEERAQMQAQAQQAPQEQSEPQNDDMAWEWLSQQPQEIQQQVMQLPEEQQLQAVQQLMTGGV